jgi:hypothetical protein
VDIPSYSSVVYRGLYPGIDMVWRVSGGHLKSEFVAAAGADPRIIRIAYSGAQGLEVAPDGRLLIHTAAGDLVEGHRRFTRKAEGRGYPFTATMWLRTTAR